jgi:hypothetical protein
MDIWQLITLRGRQLREPVSCDTVGEVRPGIRAFIRGEKRKNE